MTSKQCCINADVKSWRHIDVDTMLCYAYVSPIERKLNCKIHYADKNAMVG